MFLILDESKTPLQYIFVYVKFRKRLKGIQKCKTICLNVFNIGWTENTCSVHFCLPKVMEKI